MKEPELVTATQEELDEILRRAKPALSVQQYKLLEGVLTTFVYVMLKLQNAKTSIKRFQRMLFGHRTELKHNVLKDCTARADQSGPDAGTADAGYSRALRRRALRPMPRGQGPTARAGRGRRGWRRVPIAAGGFFISTNSWPMSVQADRYPGSSRSARRKYCTAYAAVEWGGTDEVR